MFYNLYRYFFRSKSLEQFGLTISSLCFASCERKKKKRNKNQEIVEISNTIEIELKNGGKRKSDKSNYRIESSQRLRHCISALNANELHEKRMEKEFKIQIERRKHGHG